MPTARYKFVRAEKSMQGFHSSNRPSTDALQALQIWANGSAGRSYAVQDDTDDALVAELSWSDTDRAAEADLDNCSRDSGVDRTHVQH